MGHTISEKILTKKCGKKSVNIGEIIFVNPDLVWIYDWPGFDGLVRNIGIDANKVGINIDHFCSPASEGIAKLHRNLRTSARKYNIRHFYDIGRTGIGFQLFAELGIIKPGMLVVHADPHVSTLGALGAYCVGIGADVLAGFLKGETWVKVPETLKVNISGIFEKGVSSRDLFEHIVCDLGPAGAQGKVIEFTGSTIGNMSVESRMILCNSVQYLSAETAIISPDLVTQEYVDSRSHGEYVVISSDDDASYSGEVYYDASIVEPMIVVPPDVFYIKKVKDMQNVLIDQAFIGTCASGRLEDLRLAAQILKKGRIPSSVRMIITPITPQIYAAAGKEGLLETFIEAGALIGPPTCGPCFGGFGQLLRNEKCISTGTLNISGRMGSTEAEIFLGSAATVAASALLGRITDPREIC